MKIVEVNYTDLPGRVYNGYDLHLELNRRENRSCQIVKNKKSNTDTVFEVPIEKIADSEIIGFSKEYGINNTLMPTASYIEKMPEFIDADIVHFHILHNEMISLFDYPRLMNAKKSVWTIHDPWVATGYCIYPLKCRGYKNGCIDCKSHKTAELIFRIKRNNLEKINPKIIVSTEWMKNIIINSPITKHFNDIEIIPFGVNTNKYQLDNKPYYRKKLGLDMDSVVIGFRVTDNPVKGCKYIYEALRHIDSSANITVLTVGQKCIPEDIKIKYNTIEMGWIDDSNVMAEFFVSCDIFVMPSLAESFGLMAIEAMAAECAVICFDNTVLKEITNSQDVGISVPYGSYEGIENALIRLIQDKKEIKNRGIAGRRYVMETFPYKKYIESHIKLYKEMMK